MPSRYVLLWQRLALRKLLVHAFKKVPMYGEIWHANDMDLSDLRKSDVLKKLPVINKDILRSHTKNEYLAQGIHPSYYQWRHTSGTTGEPFSFAFSTREQNIRPNRYANFLRFKFLIWDGVPLSYILKKMKILMFRVDSSLNKPRKSLSIVALHAKPEDVLRSMKDYQGELIESFGTVLVELARLVRAYKLEGALTFKYAVSIGETITTEQRKYIEKILQCELYDRYGLKEFGVIGNECALHHGFHLNNEAFVLEIVDNKGNQVPAGRSGSIVVTNLMNFCMPLVRYDTGDIGHVAVEKCKCGNPSPLFFIEGRKDVFLQFNGKKFHGREFKPMFNKLEKYILQYQVQKIDEKTIRILVVPNKQKELIKILNEVKGKIKKVVGDNITVVFKTVKHIKRMPSGKNQLVVDYSST